MPSRNGHEPTCLGEEVGDGKPAAMIDLEDILRLGCQANVLGEIMLLAATVRSLVALRKVSCVATRSQEANL